MALLRKGEPDERKPGPICSDDSSASATPAITLMTGTLAGATYAAAPFENLSSESHTTILFHFQSSLSEVFLQPSESLVALLRSYEGAIGTYDQVSGESADLIGTRHLILA